MSHGACPRRPMPHVACLSCLGHAVLAGTGWREPPAFPGLATWLARGRGGVSHGACPRRMGLGGRRGLRTLTRACRCGPDCLATPNNQGVVLRLRDMPLRLPPPLRTWLIATAASPGTGARAAHGIPYMGVWEAEESGPTRALSAGFHTCAHGSSLDGGATVAPVAGEHAPSGRGSFAADGVCYQEAFGSTVTNRWWRGPAGAGRGISRRTASGSFLPSAARQKPDAKAVAPARSAQPRPGARAQPSVRGHAPWPTPARPRISNVAAEGNIAPTDVGTKKTWSSGIKLRPRSLPRGPHRPRDLSY